MTTAQVVETSATVNNNSPIQDLIQDYVHPDDQTQPTYVLFVLWTLSFRLLKNVKNPTAVLCVTLGALAATPNLAFGRKTTEIVNMLSELLVEVKSANKVLLNNLASEL